MDFDNHQDCMDQDVPAEEFPTSKSGLMAHFLTDIPDLMNMTPEVLNLALVSLPIPLVGPISPECRFKRPYKYIKGTIYTRDNARTKHQQVICIRYRIPISFTDIVITGSEHLVKTYAVKHSLTATAIVDLIKIVQNPELNADEVDTDMLKRLQAAIGSGDLHKLALIPRGIKAT
jgi:hypothetical protein